MPSTVPGMRLLMVGPPGAGKGTQAKRLADHYGLVHIASGELFRREVAAETPLGSQAAQYLERGDLVPDELVVEMIRPIVVDAVERGGYVLDGFPRTLGQAKEAYRVAKQIQGIELQAVVHLEVPRPIVRRRLLARAGMEGRGDDLPATIEHRLDVYDEQTVPLLAFYEGRGLVVRVDGAADPDEVQQAIIAAVDGLVTSTVGR